MATLYTAREVRKMTDPLHDQIKQLTAERDALRAALLPLAEERHKYSCDRVCCDSIINFPHAPDCAAMAALRQEEQ